MNILYLDCYAGISGDMTVGALLDLGVPLDYLSVQLDLLGLPTGSFNLSYSRTERQHIAALKFDVAVHDQYTSRCYADIDALIAASRLSDSVKDAARRVFLCLAEAESLVHGVPVDDVHFHEVGAVDSIIDIVGTAICLEYLRVDKVYAAALPLGSGFIGSAHGRLPLPAPATAELLKGLMTHTECGPGERVTPTGAAIVAALAGSCGTRPQMQLEKIGTGAGGKDFEDCPNILRAFLGKSAADETYSSGVLVVETNLDDSTPEVLGYTMERLLEAGALDVWFTPIQMKKNRPAVVLSLLCQPEQLDGLAAVVLTETTAIGLRHYPVSRVVLPRRIVEQQTEFGTVRFKQVIDRHGAVVRSAPEFDDCRRIARSSGLPCQEVMRRLSFREDLQP